MKKTSLVLLSLLLIFVLSFGANAAYVPFVPSGDKVVFTDENWAYEKNNGYGYELDEYIGTSAEVEFPWSFAKEYITAVGDYAFNNNSTVISVVTTSKIERFGDFAFNFCTSLESIELFESLTSLGKSCFYANSSLSSINLEDTGVVAVPEYCFAESGITEISLPETCLSIDNMAFYHCTSLSKITIPDSVTEIADNAFLDCSNVVIYAKNGSYAIAYAIENNIPYVITNPEPETVTFLLGDADHDGVISVLDATAIQKHLAVLINDDDGWINLAGSIDGLKLNVTHATYIQKYLAHIDVPYDIGIEVTRTVES